MDDLDREIADRRATVERLREELRSAEIELAAFERAAQLRPTPRMGLVTGSPIDDTETVRKGRQPGAISQEWRRILAIIAQRFGGQATAEQIAELGVEVGISSLNPSLVRQRMTSYMQHGYIATAGGDIYCVTPHAMERFHIRIIDLPEDVSPISDEANSE